MALWRKYHNCNTNLIMIYQKYIYTLICSYLCSTFYLISADQECDKSKCPGPLGYYEALQCTPIYSTENSCCPDRYNCDNLQGRSTDKCYVNGKPYALGEKLKDEDANPCDIGCSCTRGYDGIAAFNCAVVDCFQPPAKPGCYRKNSASDCCPGEEVCPENSSDIPRCEVDGKEYLDGQAFTVQSDPSLNCVCKEGYKGENVEPFCVTPKHPYCDPGFRDASDIFNNCTPVYYSTQTPATDCSVFSRCQNAADVVVLENSRSTGVSDPVHNCIFGNLTMRVGDELNSGTDYNSVCVKCVCEVQPVPTCQRLPDEECDVTVHAQFEH